MGLLFTHTVAWVNPLSMGWTDIFVNLCGVNLVSDTLQHLDHVRTLHDGEHRYQDQDFVFVGHEMPGQARTRLDISSAH